jgi:hypothetical protein
MAARVGRKRWLHGYRLPQARARALGGCFAWWSVWLRSKALLQCWGRLSGVLSDSWPATIGQFVPKGPRHHAPLPACFSTLAMELSLSSI